MIASGKKNTVRVRLEPLGKTLRVAPGTPLPDVIHEYGVEFPCGGRGTCGGCKIKILEGDIPAGDEHRRLLEKHGLSGEWRLACRSTVKEDVVLEIGQFEHIILADSSSYPFTPREGYGIAIDLGTSTLVAQLIDLSTGKVCEAVTSVNPQSGYGADIMSRIAYSLKEGGLQKLRSLILGELKERVTGLLKENAAEITKIVITGNTVMHHLFGGIDLEPLSHYPFKTENCGQQVFESGQLGWDIPGNPPVTFLPSLGSFVGSDILAGILSTELHKKKELTALIDLGTNGEIVLGNRDKIYFSSTAAGPAFEGTNISMGMRATRGAISSVTLRNQSIHCHVLGNVKPTGICGSGLIDAVHALLVSGRIDETGQITGDGGPVELMHPVTLNQKDIREFQLAKAALSAGLRILLEKAGEKAGDIDRLYIAGAFGNFIDVSNVISLGMIELPEDKISKIGNSSLLGAKISLFHHTHNYTDIRNLSEHVSLESNAGFQEIFAQKMFFFKTG